MKRILFVCLGNICRSPMAEFLLKDMVEKRGLAQEYEIASAAISSDEIGNGVHPGTRRILAARGISCAGKTAVQLRREDYARYDAIIGMDHGNLRAMQRLFGGDPENKLHLLLEFAGIDRDIADPWYTGDFEATQHDVLLGCEALLARLEKKGI